MRDSWRTDLRKIPARLELLDEGLTRDRKVPKEVEVEEETDPS